MRKPRRTFLMIQVSPDLKRRLQEKAKQEGGPLSQMIRLVLIRHLNGAKRP